MNAKNVTYFDSFRVEHIPKEIRKFFRNKNIIRNIYRIQAYDSIMCGYFGIGFIDFMLKGKSLLECTNLCSPNEYKKNDFKKVRMIKTYWIKCKKYKIFIKPTISYICHKILLLSRFCNKCGSEDEKIFMEQESLEILKILGSINNLENYQNI